jgi:hypothetical protein
MWKSKEYSKELFLKSLDIAFYFPEEVRVDSEFTIDLEIYYDPWFYYIMISIVFLLMSAIVIIFLACICYFTY